MPSESTWRAPFQKPETDARPAGYAWLVQQHELDVLPHWRWTFVANRHVHKELDQHGRRVHLLPSPRYPGDSAIDHLLFALRYDGVSLPICRALFHLAEAEALGHAIAKEVHRTPTGAYARRAWFLFEELTGKRLDLDDVRQGNYVPLLDSSVHVTGPVRKHRRQRIDINLLGTIDFAPVLRWTEALRSASGEALRCRIDALVSGYDDHTVRRAISYLYTRETMASFEIERERPPQTRAERFVALLREAPHLQELSLDELTRLQNAIVDPRFSDPGWRTEQNYVGESLDLVRQRIHFISPRPEDLHKLMAGFLDMVRTLRGAPDPVLSTAAISFAFVLLHPFTDGNGRLHRWLIHWGLSRGGVTPEDLIVPVSAVMLSHRREYDEALESFSTSLMERVTYDLDADGRMIVETDTADWYRHPDLTDMAVGLWHWLNLAVDRELPDELRFLVSLGLARARIQEIVDMPDRLIVLFIKLCRANGGRLSIRKRNSHFDMLTNDELKSMEEVVQELFTTSA